MIYGVCHIQIYGIYSYQGKQQPFSQGVCHIQIYGIYSMDNLLGSILLGVSHIKICGIYSSVTYHLKHNAGVCHIEMYGIYSKRLINAGCMSYRNVWYMQRRLYNEGVYHIEMVYAAECIMNSI